MSSDGFNRIAIAGVGLIGGSVGLAIKKSGFHGKIIGLGRRLSSLKKAIDVGAIDSATMDYAEALENADLLLIGAPVDTIAYIAKEAVKFAKKRCIITDVGSAKAQLVAEIEEFIPSDVYFVGAHPMAGSHNSGVEAANGDLFRGSICIITPTESTNSDALKLISDLWRIMGARVEIMSPKDHDFLISAASHLPHVVASALTQVVGNIRNERGKAIDFAGRGFKDTTRIAAADPKIWKGILMQNADMISPLLEKMEMELTEVRKALNDRDEQKIIEKLEQAKQIKES